MKQVFKLPKLLKLPKPPKYGGFTLIEAIIVVAILTALTASAIYALSPGDKIASAEEAGLKQILISRVPTELTQHRLKNGDLSGFKLSDNSVVFMENWPGVKKTNKLKFTPTAQRLTLDMETTFDAANLMSTLAAMQSVNASITNKVLKVEYTIQ